MTTLQGAVVLVVGATGGLGSRMAAQLESNGAIVARSSKSAGHDLRAPSVIREVLEDTNAQHGRLDGLVVASGVVAFGAASDLEPATVDELFAVNTTSPIQLITQSQPYLAASAREGRWISRADLADPALRGALTAPVIEGRPAGRPEALLGARPHGPAA